MLERCAHSVQAHGNRLMLAGVGAQIAKQVDKTGVSHLIGKGSIPAEDEHIVTRSRLPTRKRCAGLRTKA
jgi:hypothetical protein